MILKQSGEQGAIMQAIREIHHISAMVGDLEKVLVFYRKILGLRLVKKTVNFDDKIGYHLYFGSQSALLSPLISFFPEQLQTGHKGSGQVGKSPKIFRYQN
ncbi:VOC family protein [Streptococcus pluranimalium]|uniref:VOC family protein n=1 Tax=Streptococcus pluranimalium TaxID=82348 RepID=UPI003F663054